MVPRLSALIVALALAAGGCVTPSIPIPPPEPERMTFTLDVDVGVASFSYGPQASYADAVVYVYNRDRGEGIITTARSDGSVGPTAPFPALVNDEIAITFETADSLAGTCVQILAGGRAGYCQ